MICLCQGGFGLLGGGADEGAVLARFARALRPGGRLAVSAFYAVLRAAPPGSGRHVRRGDAGCNHERAQLPGRRRRRARVRPLDHLLHAARARAARGARPACDVDAVHGVTPGRYGASPPSIDQPELLLLARRPEVREARRRGFRDRSAFCTLNGLLRRSGPSARLPSYPFLAHPGNQPAAPTVPTIRNEVLDQQTDTTAADLRSGGTAPRKPPKPRRRRPEPRHGGASADEDAVDEGRSRTTTRSSIDDLGGMSFDDAIDATIVAFDDGDIVTGEVVKVDKDEVLLDIGFKSEGVIPSRELSIRNDIDPSEIVSLGDD